MSLLDARYMIESVISRFVTLAENVLPLIIKLPVIVKSPLSVPVVLARALLALAYALLA